MSNLKRRDFIKNTLVAGIASSLPPGLALGRDAAAAHPAAVKATASPKKVIVAGAGITGLCCAYELMKKGHEVLVLEANGRHGGHVFTGRDGLSEGLYADFGADHITQPGYERFFDYVKEFNLTVLPYPNAEGSEAKLDGQALKMIDGVFYRREQLAEAPVLKKLGFNDSETSFLKTNPWYELKSLFLNSYIDKFKEEQQPFGIGYDALDNVSINEIFKKEGASPAALRFIGEEDTSALYYLWRLGSMKHRGIPLSEGDTFHVKGGNQELPNAFARRLAHRVLLKHPIVSIRHSETGITVSYKEYGYPTPKEETADYLVNCIPLRVFRNIPVTPALSPQKQYVMDNLGYSSHPFYVFEASSKFWLADGLQSINMEFEHSDISSIWQETNEVDTGRVVLKAFGPGGISPQRVLAAFRKLYPGKRDTIEQVLTVDWTKDLLSPACEMEAFPIGEMHRFWPEIQKPNGRIYFAGTYADNLSRGMESCIRSAQRVAHDIDVL